MAELFKKADIADLLERDIEAFYKLLVKEKRDRNILLILRHLGKLPTNFNASCLLPLLNSENEDIRLLVVKNIGKTKSDLFLDQLYNVSKNDISTLVRREAVSSIGRMRSQKAKAKLITILDDPDPKVILQAIRGLLVFKSDPEIYEKLISMQKHPNEIIQAAIEKELHNVYTSKVDPKIHTNSPDYLKNTIVQGDVREILKRVPSESVHLTFTSPPYYNARDYSIYQSYKEYLEFLANVFKEVHRITKEGRFFLLNTSPVIIPRFSRSHSSIRYPIPFDIHPYLTEMGWEFIDDIVWVKPEASVKNRNGGFLQHRKPLAYKPNSVTELVMVYRKKTDKLIDWNINRYDDETIEASKVLGDYETTNLWSIAPAFDKVHSAVFPLELCYRVIKYYSFKNDLVFDPFGGSGTLGKAAMDLDRYFFLTEIKNEYIESMKKYFSQRKINSIVTPKTMNIGSFDELLRAYNK